MFNERRGLMCGAALLASLLAGSAQMAGAVEYGVSMACQPDIGADMLELQDLMAKVRPEQVMNQPDWLSAQAWSELEEGMQASEVLQSLGEPRLKEASNGGEKWLYGPGATDAAHPAIDAGYVVVKGGRITQVKYFESRNNKAFVQWLRTIVDAPKGKTPAREAASEVKAVVPEPRKDGLPLYLFEENWPLVKSGMSEEQVTAILGKPMCFDEFGWHFPVLSSDRLHIETLGGIQVRDKKVLAMNGFDPNVMRREREFWVANGLRLDADLKQMPAGLEACPKWCNLNAWVKIKGGDSKERVEELLGKPSVAREGDWEYRDWAIGALQPVGRVNFAAPGGGVSSIEIPSPASLTDLRARLAFHREHAGSLPAWTAPAGWLSLTAGLRPDGVVALLGEPMAKQASEQRVTWMYGDPADQSRWMAEVHFSGGDFPKFASARGPGWDGVKAMASARGGVEADVPVWSNPEVWVRMQSRFLTRCRELEIDPDQVSLINTPRSVDWEHGTGEFAGLWQAVLSYPNGAVLVWSPLVPTAVPHPDKISGKGMIVAVRSGPDKGCDLGRYKALRVRDLNTVSMRTACVAWFDYAMQAQLDRHDLKRGSVYAQEVRDVTGAPDKTTQEAIDVYLPTMFPPTSEADLAGGLESAGPLPLNIGVKVSVLHFGEGRVYIGDLEQGSGPEHGDLLGITPPTSERMHAASGTTRWPDHGPATHKPDESGRPHYLDGGRWDLIDANARDSVLWVLYVLGQPSSVEWQQNENEDHPHMVWKYGPWHNDKEEWNSGKVHVYGSRAKSERPTKNQISAGGGTLRPAPPAAAVAAATVAATELVVKASQEVPAAAAVLKEVPEQRGVAIASTWGTGSEAMSKRGLRKVQFVNGVWSQSPSRTIVNVELEPVPDDAGKPSPGGLFELNWEAGSGWKATHLLDRGEDIGQGLKFEGLNQPGLSPNGLDAGAVVFNKSGMFACGVEVPSGSAPEGETPTALIRFGAVGASLVGWHRQKVVGGMANILVEDSNAQRRLIEADSEVQIDSVLGPVAMFADGTVVADVVLFVGQNSGHSRTKALCWFGPRGPEVILSEDYRIREGDARFWLPASRGREDGGLAVVVDGKTLVYACRPSIMDVDSPALWTWQPGGTLRAATKTVPTQLYDKAANATMLLDSSVGVTALFHGMDADEMGTLALTTPADVPSHRKLFQATCSAARDGGWVRWHGEGSIVLDLLQEVRDPNVERTAERVWEVYRIDRDGTFERVIAAGKSPTRAGGQPVVEPAAAAFLCGIGRGVLAGVHTRGKKLDEPEADRLILAEGGSVRVLADMNVPLTHDSGTFDWSQLTPIASNEKGEIVCYGMSTMGTVVVMLRVDLESK